eukprot:TRINITY_DN6810_c0_g1_i2.p1 TRINITY_DN6810_c0_g1~~TRINITY_DN6810_c0_g1_i2.p1  ORF type:complete len:272 (-),score=53.22 TRINITY_DN6810_c0_g1_i2:190-1005(-)
MEQRKQRIELLLSEQGRVDKHHFQKLRDGRFLCLVCSSRPVLDTIPMFLMHSKGRNHQIAISQLKESTIVKREELEKKRALGQVSCYSNDNISSPHSSVSLTSPLLQKAQKCAKQAVSKTSNQGSTQNDGSSGISRNKPFFASSHAKSIQPSHSSSDYQKSEASVTYKSTVRSHKKNGNPKNKEDRMDLKDAQVQVQTPTSQSSSITFVSQEVTSSVNQMVHFEKQKERELKFRAAGWRRDSQGGWFKEENVEFDSDEEDPNISMRINEHQ